MSISLRDRRWEWTLLRDKLGREYSYTWHITVGMETACGHKFDDFDVKNTKSKAWAPPSWVTCQTCLNALDAPTNGKPHTVEQYNRDRLNMYDLDAVDDLQLFDPDNHGQQMGYHMVPRRAEFGEGLHGQQNTPKRTPPPVVVELPMAVKDNQLVTVGTVKRKIGEELVIAANGWIYRKQTGSISAWVPFNERFAKEYGFSDQKFAQLIEWDRTKCPPPWALRRLHEELFGHYDHEVMVLNGLDANGNWVFGIPKQEVSRAGADMDPDEGQVSREMQEAGLTILGVSHCHPGNWTDFSGTDKALFTKTPGIHPILSEDGKKFSIHGSVMGYVWTFEKDLDLAEEQPLDDRYIRFIYSGGQELKDLLLEPRWVRQPTGRNWTTYGEYTVPTGGTTIIRYPGQNPTNQPGRTPGQKPPAAGEPKWVRKWRNKFIITKDQMVVIRDPFTKQLELARAGDIPVKLRSTMVNVGATFDVMKILQGQ